MSQDTSKAPRAYLGEAAQRLLETHGGDPNGNLTKRLDTAITTLLSERDATAKELEKRENGQTIFPDLLEHLDQRADLTTELIKDGFASMARELTSLKSEVNNTHITINVLRSFLVMVVAALRNEDLDQQTEMVMAEIDQLIKPMINRSYDPAPTRLRRRHERELTERQTSPIATEPVLASGNQFEHTNGGERER